MTNLRLCRETDTIQDPPAPIPFKNAATWRTTEDTPKEDAMDSIEIAQSALDNAESKMAELKEIMDEEIESYSFAQWTNTDNDEGPFAA
jgi:hypothetical protein